MRAGLHFVIMLLVLTALALGQTTTGTPAFATFAGGPLDTIDLGNLNVHFTLPILNKPGRGIPATFAFSYDSSIWYPGSYGGMYNVWQSLSNQLGWKIASTAVGGYISYSTSMGDCWSWADTADEYYDIYTLDYYVDNSGTMHPVGLSVNDIQEVTTCGTPVETSNASALLSDGSGLTVYFDNTLWSQVWTAGGVNLSPANDPSSLGFGSQDTNGNFAAFHNDDTILTDTLGTSALTTTGSPSSGSVTYTFKTVGGGSNSVTVTYNQYTAQTAFGCFGIREATISGIYLPVQVSRSDGSTTYSYLIQYEQTPGYPSGYTTGRVSNISLPNGGSISYSYNGGNDSISCADGSTTSFTRVVNPNSGDPQGTWTYNRSGSGTQWTTTETDPAGNDTVLNFSNLHETSRLVYQGNHNGGTVLKNIFRCYNNNFSNCPTATVEEGVLKVDIYDALTTGLTSTTEIQYDNYGLPTTEYDWDYGNDPNTGHGPLLRQKTMSYARLGRVDSQGDPLIADHPLQVSIYDGSGNLKAQTNYSYDETTGTGHCGLSSTNAPSHTSVSGPRGNVTTISKLVSGSTYASSQFCYDDTGNVVQALDPGGHQTSFTYDASAYAFVTQTTLPNTGTAHVTHATYDPSTGLLTSSSDQNGQVTNYRYDTLLRPTETDFPDGGKTIVTYSGTNQIWTWAYRDASTYQDFRQHVDGLGRIDRTALWNGGAWDKVDSCFNSIGQVAFTSYPFTDGQGWSIAKACSSNGDSFAYDGVGRTTSVTHYVSGSAAGTVQAAYNGRAVRVQDEGNGSFNATRIMQSDILGRLINVCEVSSGTLLGSGGIPASCALDYAGTGFLTSYGYDALDNLIHVDQGGYATRTYGYDGLSRLTSESFPEQFECTTSYNYDNDGLLTSRVRPAPNQGSCSTNVTTTYTYDEMHRLRTRSYSDGTTPTATFNYDEGNTWGWATSNALGRLTSATAGSAGDIFPGADSMGRILHNGKCTPRTCGWGGYDHYYTYDYLGNVTSFNNAGLYTLTENYNSAARLTSVTSSLVDSQHPSTIINNISYGPFGVSSDTLGNGINESFGYNSRGMLNSYSAGSAYSFTLGLASDSLVSSANDSVNGNWTYNYDQFDRIVGASKTGTSLTWAYDRFGNRWQQNGGGSQYTIDTNNHINNPDSGISYDVLGNVLNDGLGHSFYYDAENRLVNVNGTAYVYDAFGRRVKNGSYEFLYDLDGNAVTLLGATDGGWAYGEIYAGGKHLATYSGGTTNFLHTDWLGTKRAMTSVSGAQSMTCTGLPFGESSGCATAWNFNSFSDDFHDSESNTEHTLFRQLSSTEGRWLSPDPYMGSIDLTNPQSLNRYSYVLNGPTYAIDPMGLWSGDRGPGGAVGGSEYERQFQIAMGEANCALDGISIGCNFAGSLLNDGAAAICPFGDCRWVRTGPNGHWQVWVPGSSSGVQESHHGATEWVMKLTTGYWTDDERLEAELRAGPQIMYGDVAISGLGSAAEEILAFAERGISRELLEEAAARYPKLADLTHEHHVIPKYLGGESGPLRTIPAAYHQLITNATRELAPYGRSAALTATRIRDILIEVYTKYPLP